ncbi:MAG: hypothetical protein LBS45_07895 [Synergistaceae bacterium]|nr:hypothetical protein [Synergistaceae bacterium]
MRKRGSAALIITIFILFNTGLSEAVPKSIVLRTPDRGGVLGYIAQSMIVQGYKMTVSEPYRMVFEKKSHSLLENTLYREPWVFKNPVFRKTWSVLPSQDGLEAVVDTFFVSSPGTEWEKAYDTDKALSRGDSLQLEKEKLYDLYDLKAAAEGLDRYFLMRVSGLFPELKPDFPKADMLMEGNRIIAVLPDGLAGRVGVRAGDIVLEMNGVQVAGDIVEFIDSRLVQGNRVMLLIQRNNAKEVITLTDPDTPPYQKQKREPYYPKPPEGANSK